jgi:hypothetical protein
MDKSLAQWEPGVLPKGVKIRLADTAQPSDIGGMTAARANRCTNSVEFGGDVQPAPPLSPLRDPMAKIGQPHPRQVVSLWVEKHSAQMRGNRRPIGAPVLQVQDVDDEDPQQTTNLLVGRRR